MNRIATLKEQNGFTLIEVIVTIIIAALLGVVIFTYLGTALTRSAEPVVMVRDLAGTIEGIEEITAKYTEYLENPSAVSGGLSCSWLTADLNTPAGIVVSCTDVSSDLGMDFDSFVVTMTRGNQTIAALFTE